MIVLDASVIVDLVLNVQDASKIRARLFEFSDEWIAPHLIDVEFLQALRRHFLNKSITQKRAMEAIDDYRDLPIERFPHSILIEGIWNLRENFSAYDAAYVTLAGIFDAPLLTRDKKLASQAKATNKIVLV